MHRDDVNPLAAVWRATLESFGREAPKLSHSAMGRAKRGFCAVIGCGNVSEIGSMYCHPTRCDDFFETLTDDEMKEWEL